MGMTTPRFVRRPAARLASPAVATHCDALVLLLYVFLSLVIFPRNVDGQEPPTSDQQAQPVSQQQSASTRGQPSSNAIASPESALDNLVLEQADEERNITSIQSRVTFTYDHDTYDGGSTCDCFQVNWLQSFGPSSLVAAEIELPFSHYDGGKSEPSSDGIGDITLKLMGMIGRGEKFEHAAGVEVTLPTASNKLLGEGETVVKVVWGFSMPVTPHTLLSGEVGYNKAVETSQGHLGTNDIEPELILTQAFAKRLGGYLDWDSYYDFDVSRYAQTLRLGLNVELDHREKWSLSPYFEVPLNHFTQTTLVKHKVGVELSYHF